MKTTYFNIRVARANNREEAIEAIENGEFDESHDLNDLVLTITELKDQAAMLEEREEVEEVIAYIFHDLESPDQDITVILSDGGVATAHNNGEHILTEYYGNRIDGFTDPEDLFEDIEVHSCKAWDGASGRLITEAEKDDLDTIVDDMIDWLYATTGERNLSKVDMGKWDSNKATLIINSLK